MSKHGVGIEADRRRGCCFCSPEVTTSELCARGNDEWKRISRSPGCFLIGNGSCVDIASHGQQRLSSLKRIALAIAHQRSILPLATMSDVLQGLREPGHSTRSKDVTAS
jgi:hypothetical protein